MAFDSKPSLRHLIGPAELEILLEKKPSKITQRKLEQILIHQGLVHAAAIEDPDGYDGGITMMRVRMAAKEITEADADHRPGSGAFPNQ